LFAARPSRHHLWLQLNRSDFVSHVLRDGLAVVGGDAFAVGENAPLGVRVSLGAARNRAELAQALHVLSAALKSPPAPVQIV